MMVSIACFALPRLVQPHLTTPREQMYTGIAHVLIRLHLCSALSLVVSIVTDFFLNAVKVQLLRNRLCMLARFVTSSYAALGQLLSCTQCIP